MGEKRVNRSTKPQDINARRSDTSLEALDQRLGVVRALRVKLDQLITHLGGPTEVSYPEESLCRRAVNLERWLEHQEHALARAGVVDIHAWLVGMKELRGLFTAIGMKRRPKFVGGSLAELLTPKESRD